MTVLLISGYRVRGVFPTRTLCFPFFSILIFLIPFSAFGKFSPTWKIFSQITNFLYYFSSTIFLTLFFWLKNISSDTQFLRQVYYFFDLHNFLIHQIYKTIFTSCIILAIWKFFPQAKVCIFFMRISLKHLSVCKNPKNQ